MGGVNANNLIAIFMEMRQIVIVISTSKALLKSQAYQSTSFIHEHCEESKVFFQRVVKRSSGSISRRPEGNRVAVKVGVVQMVND